MPFGLYMSTCIPPTSLLDTLYIDTNDLGFESMPKKRRHRVYPNALHIDVFTGQWRFFRYQSKCDRIDSLLHIKPSRVVDMLPANDMFIYDDNDMITCTRLNHLYQARSSYYDFCYINNSVTHRHNLRTRYKINEMTLSTHHSDHCDNLTGNISRHATPFKIPFHKHESFEKQEFDVLSHALTHGISSTLSSDIHPLTQPKTTRKRTLPSHPSQNRYFIWFEANQQMHPKNYLIDPFLKSKYLSDDRLESPIFGNVILKFEDHVPWFGLFNACVYADYEEWRSCTNNTSFYYDLLEDVSSVGHSEHNTPFFEQIPKFSWLERFRIAIQNDFYDPLTSADLMNEFHHEA